MSDANQDFTLCKQLSDGSCLAVLADGMGGLQHGEITAATVAQSIYETLTRYPSVDIKTHRAFSYSCTTIDIIKNMARCRERAACKNDRACEIHILQALELYKEIPSYRGKEYAPKYGWGTGSSHIFY